MDIIAIEDAIHTLEEADTTADNVAELASLYIVYENNKKTIQKMVEAEYDDILPAYRKYCATKRRYQLGEITEGAVINDLKLLCSEIREFIHALYCHTDMNRERKLLEDLISNLTI